MMGREQKVRYSRSQTQTSEPSLVAKSKNESGSEKRELCVIVQEAASFLLLALPKGPVVVEVDDIGGMVGRDILHQEALSHFALDELRRTLVPLVGVLVEDGGVVLVGSLAALDHQQDQAVKLRVGVVGVVHVCG